MVSSEAITAIYGLYLLSSYYAAAVAVTEKENAISTHQKSLAPFLHKEPEF